MKKLLSLFSVILTVCLLAACGTDSAPVKISVEQNQSVFYFNDYKNTFVFTAKTENAADGAVIRWKTSDETVASVDENGKVKFLKDGTCDVVAYLASDESVFSAVSVTGICLNVNINRETDEIDLFYGTELKLSYSIDDGKTEKYTDFVWKSSDETVAVVDENGVVNALSKGETLISVTKSDCDYVTDSFMISIVDSTDKIAEEKLKEEAEEFSSNMSGVNFTDGITVFGKPIVSTYKENDSVKGFYFGAAATGETRLKYKVPVTLKAGSKYVMTFNVEKAGETSLWGNFSIGILNVVALSGNNKGYSPTMWGYANNGNADSHATENDYAESVRLTGSNVDYISYTGSAEFVMKTELSEVWLDLRMTNATLGNNVLIKEITLEEDTGYLENLKKEAELYELLHGIGADNYIPVTFSPTIEIIETDGKVSGLSVTATSAALRFRYKLNTTLEAGKTYKMSFTVNETGTIGLWGSLGVGILNVVQNGSASPTMWGYANNGNTASHDTVTDYAKDVTLTGSGSTTFAQTATFTMTQTLEEITIDFNIPNCTPGELFTLTAFNIEEVTEN